MIRALARVIAALTGGALLGASPAGSGGVATGALASLSPEELCVTLGAITQDADGMRVDAPKMRAVATGITLPEAELKFTYLGPSTDVALLGSGKLRRQIGIKLRAADSCNLVYAMWRLEPVPGIVVSVKRNPGMTAHAECRNGGYEDVKPVRAGIAPPVTMSSAHALRAAITGETLRVWTDGVLVWEGELGGRARGIDGPIGVRTDNGRFRFQLAAGMQAGTPTRVTCTAKTDE